jgi:hypothetical protein
MVGGGGGGSRSAAVVLRHDMKDLTLSVYTEEEIRKLSVVRVVSSVTFDRLGNPLVG